MEAKRVHVTRRAHLVLRHGSRKSCVLHYDAPAHVNSVDDDPLLVLFGYYLKKASAHEFRLSDIIYFAPLEELLEDDDVYYGGTATREWLCCTIGEWVHGLYYEEWLRESEEEVDTCLPDTSTMNATKDSPYEDKCAALINVITDVHKTWADVSRLVTSLTTKEPSKTPPYNFPCMHNGDELDMCARIVHAIPMRANDTSDAAAAFWTGLLKESDAVCGFSVRKYIPAPLQEKVVSLVGL